MSDRPLVRRAVPTDPRLDQWMLDRWSAPAAHVVTLHSRERRVTLQRQTFVDVEFRSICVCGWRSIETMSPTVERCPVGDALDDRARRMKRPGERVEWEPVNAVHYLSPEEFDREPDPRD